MTEIGLSSYEVKRRLSRAKLEEKLRKAEIKKKDAELTQQITLEDVRWKQKKLNA